MVVRVMHHGGEARRTRIGNEDGLGGGLKVDESEAIPRMSRLFAVNE